MERIRKLRHAAGPLVMVLVFAGAAWLAGLLPAGIAAGPDGGSVHHKFDLVWKPKYLASPGGLALPRMLADLTALIAKKRKLEGTA